MKKILIVLLILSIFLIGCSKEIIANTTNTTAKIVMVTSIVEDTGEVTAIFIAGLLK